MGDLGGGCNAHSYCGRGSSCIADFTGLCPEPRKGDPGAPTTVSRLKTKRRRRLKAGLNFKFGPLRSLTPQKRRVLKPQAHKHRAGPGYKDGEDDRT